MTSFALVRATIGTMDGTGRVMMKSLKYVYGGERSLIKINGLFGLLLRRKLATSGRRARIQR